MENGNFYHPLIDFEVNLSETRGKTNKGKFLRAARH